MRKLLFAFLVLSQPALAQQVIAPSSGSVISLYANGTSVGNGADTTEDTLMTYTLPANTLANVGDAIHIIAGGTFAGTTDNKTARVRFGGIAGVAIGAPNGATTGQLTWYIDGWIVKTGSNTQSFISGGQTTTNNNGSLTGTASKTDTATNDIVVTGRNVTASSASSITCQTLLVQYVKASGT